jgi:Type II site-specific deoxyribonuclease
LGAILKGKAIAHLVPKLKRLSQTKLDYVDSIVSALLGELAEERNKNSDIVSELFLEEFGVHLLAHHGTSTRPLTKEQFERAIERVARRSDRKAERAKAGNPGHDIDIDGVKYSLKTQADAGIKSGTLWISKFMELGKGAWTDKPGDLTGLLKQFVNHLKNYERILSLRAFSSEIGGKIAWRYELVEIPKSLLLEAARGKLEMKLDSRQMPKPGYCTVVDRGGKVKFRLYFDAGGERKLQIKDLRIDLCTVHAEWSFMTE